jgi:hypothetical protein
MASLLLLTHDNTTVHGTNAFPFVEHLLIGASGITRSQRVYQIEA